MVVFHASERVAGHKTPEAKLSFKEEGIGVSKM